MLAAATCTAGVVVERLAYDPWGKRRFITGAADTLDAITGVNIDHGFTMHEHIDEMGIINMNGRIYDPLIGRFMSADPYIQAPDDLQSHNRYAYVMNNPLNLDDPSGYWSISKLWKKVWKSPIFKAIVGIAVAFVAPYALTWMAPTLFGASSLATALATGALSGFASTGTLKGALTGAFTAGIMFGVGEIGQALKLESGGIGKVALHAGAGCLSSVAGGGSCKTGAISGALGELGNNIPDGGKLLNTVKASMLGGIGSKMAGGKFEDGATTGAFGYLFNELLHSGAGAMQRAGYKETKYDDGSYCNIQGGSGACGMPGGKGGSSDPMQGSFSAGGTGIIGIGNSADIGPVRSMNGQCAIMQNNCLLIGPMAAASIDANVSISQGTPSDGWSLSVVGKANTPVTGFSASLGYGRDGWQGQGGYSKGVGGGVAGKLCIQTKIANCP